MQTTRGDVAHWSRVLIVHLLVTQALVVGGIATAFNTMQLPWIDLMLPSTKLQHRNQVCRPLSASDQKWKLRSTFLHSAGSQYLEQSAPALVMIDSVGLRNRLGWKNTIAVPIWKETHCARGAWCVVFRYWLSRSAQEAQGVSIAHPWARLNHERASSLSFPSGLEYYAVGVQP
jgi:hypothetical protein